MASGQRRRRGHNEYEVTVDLVLTREKAGDFVGGVYINFTPDNIHPAYHFTSEEFEVEIVTKEYCDLYYCREQEKLLLGRVTARRVDFPLLESRIISELILVNVALALDEMKKYHKRDPWQPILPALNTRWRKINQPISYDWAVKAHGEPKPREISGELHVFLAEPHLIVLRQALELGCKK
ncbi:hypothetical protein HYW32_03080 [Candidatus Berkelbacteria bacterium]|nr:hypothetical protein [Candidatus Berkelbacteria bacterium]